MASSSVLLIFLFQSTAFFLLPERVSNSAFAFHPFLIHSPAFVFQSLCLAFFVEFVFISSQ